MNYLERWSATRVEYVVWVQVEHSPLILALLPEKEHERLAGRFPSLNPSS